jgi:formylglycine-generating enzyme required for sulfatase activity
VNVSWQDAVAFCDWLSKREGRDYRLPTDAEWSVAVGLGKESGSTPEEKSNKIEGVYPWGRSWPPPKGAGNYNRKEDGNEFSQYSDIPGTDGVSYTSSVGSFEENRYGLYDMGGNVSECCLDWYDSSKYQSRVMRGKCWLADGEGGLSSSSRGFTGPTTNRGYSDGFRCVVSVR